MEYALCPICGDPMRIKRTAHYECEQIYGNMQFVSWGSGEEEVEDDPKPKVPRVSKKVKS